MISFKDYLNVLFIPFLLIPFLLGNSAGGIAALVSLLGYMVGILVGAVMIYYAIKWFR